MGASLVKQTRSTTFRDLRSREHREQLRAIFFRDLFTSTGSPGTPGFFPSRILINWVRDPLDPWNNSMFFLVLYDRRIVPNFHEKFWNLELGTRWNSAIDFRYFTNYEQLQIWWIVVLNPRWPTYLCWYHFTTPKNPDVGRPCSVAKALLVSLCQLRRARHAHPVSACNLNWSWSLWCDRHEAAAPWILHLNSSRGL